MKIAPSSPLHDSLLEGEKEHGKPCPPAVFWPREHGMSILSGLLVALVAGLAMHGSPPSVESAAVQTEGEGTSNTKPSVSK